MNVTNQPKVPNRPITQSLFTTFLIRLNSSFALDILKGDLPAHRAHPARFAFRVLGSRWWHRQEEIARALASCRRVAVKSANGIGKTYLAADLALWFLYTHQPAVVLTTAPTWRQVRHVLWEEIRNRFVSARVRLPGTLLATRINAGHRWFAMGLSTDHAVKFQGFHADNLLIIFDEASGIPDSIWHAAEGIAVAQNNKILAIGNPLRTEGRFYQIFRDRSGWHKLTVSALEHPNITGKGPPIPGCVTLPYLEDRLSDWCELLLPSPVLGRGERCTLAEGRGEGPFPSDMSDMSDPSDPSDQSSIVHRQQLRHTRQSISHSKVSPTDQTTSSALAFSASSRMPAMNLSSPSAG